MKLQCKIISLLIIILFSIPLEAAKQTKTVKTDLLIVGGTESGWAAALQAARMGIPKIVIVNDIEWLGGQFTAEGLVAIDENRNPQGYGHGVPFPRAGLFKELMDRIEKDNLERYGVPRPGNTQVITTARPVHIQKIFKNFLAPYLQTGQIKLINQYRPTSTVLTQSQNKLTEVHFQSTQNQTQHEILIVKAKLTIDASDWGDVIKKTPAEYEFGPDLKGKYHEPLAPISRKGYPLTDMNPITYCLILKETEKEQVIPKPRHYDRRNYDGMYSQNPSVIYKSRRIVDHYHFKNIQSPDFLLVCYATHDYPLDVLPDYVNEALEKTEKGASRKNIVQMTPEQRQIVFEDAKDYALGYLYYLQTVIYDKSKGNKHNFRKLVLSDEFGTPDSLPFKPYVRESLRLKAMYMMKQQDTTGYGRNSSLFAQSMYHDGIACWQFEYDFHPTARKFLTENRSGPWKNYFRKGRTWGPPYSGRSLFPCRSLIPEKINGLITAQKNLGYSSIVSSALRLHDQCIAVGQSAGSVAAISLQEEIDPRLIPGNSKLLAKIWESLCTRKNNSIPHTLWPFRDLEPTHSAFEAVNLLAVRQVLSLQPYEIDFLPDSTAEKDWIQKVTEISKSKKQIPNSITLSDKQLTRGEFAIQWWNKIKDFPEIPFPNNSSKDFDSDGIPNHEDPLPYHSGTNSWPEKSIRPDRDGSPDPESLKTNFVKAFNFANIHVEAVKNFEVDSGERYTKLRKTGWKRDISNNNRTRSFSNDPLRSTFLFTRSHDIWNTDLPNGKYKITVCIGDDGHSQVGQNVTIEGDKLFQNISTIMGEFREKTAIVEVIDNRLTVEIGKEKSHSNTCLNWIIIQKLEQSPTSTETKLTLSYKNNILSIHGDYFPGKIIPVNYLEAYCRANSTDADWGKHTVIKHETETVSMNKEKTILKLKSIVADGIILHHTITAKSDEVDFRITAHNPTPRRSEAHWVQPCIRVGDFTGFGNSDTKDKFAYIKKCFIFLDGKPSFMPTPNWAMKARYTPGQVWCPVNVPRTDVNPRPLSNEIPSNGLIGCYSKSNRWIFATAFEPYQELFQGVIRCIHADFRLGGLKPGETKKIKGKIYIVPADMDRLVKRYKKDFPEQIQ